jgi:hypothetical protein
MGDRPGGHGPVCRMSWDGDAYPSDWRRGGRGRSKGRAGPHRSPKPGGRTGPVRNLRRGRR